MAHSLIRVGACVILQAMGCTESQIRWLLRWRSNAFMVYLRNVAILSSLHHQKLDEAAEMPHFFKKIISRSQCVVVQWDSRPTLMK
jgi:hypothetical protein